MELISAPEIWWIPVHYLKYKKLHDRKLSESVK